MATAVPTPPPSIPRTTTGDREISAFKLKILWSLLVAAISMGGGSLIVVARGLYAKGSSDAEHDMTIRSLVDHKLDSERHIRSLEDKVLMLEVRQALGPANGSGSSAPLFPPINNPKVIP